MALPSPPDSRHSSLDEDLESGRGTGMSERLRDDIPVSRLVSPAHNSNPSAAVESPPSPPPEDLLVESDSLVLETTPIIQAISPSSPTLINDSQPESIIDAPSDSVLVPEEHVKEDPTMNLIEEVPTANLIEEPTTDLIEPDVTIRLVGGGGSSGDVAELAASKEDDILDDAEVEADVASLASNNSVTSESNNPTNAIKHRKTKSGLAGLKKLGLGKKKKASVSSTKDAVAVDSKQ